MTERANKDHWTHFLAYVVAGAFLGGALDLFVFRMGTPVYGVVGGGVIALIYVGILWLLGRRSSRA